MNVIKIIFIGPKGVGKTTIKKIFFEQEDPIKLLNNALEPTYGAETNIYDVGKKIAIHDLAGQQIEEWLTYSSDVFIDSDLIISVFDCQEEWEPNLILIQRIAEIRNSYCPNAYYGILFHKIDLVSPDQQKVLTTLINENVNIIPRTSGFTTSISENFFIQTFKDVIFIIKESLLNIHDINLSSYLSNYILLSQFIDKNQKSLKDVFNIVGTDSDSINISLKQMQTDGFIKIDESNNSVFLSEKGENVLNILKTRISTSIKGAELFKKIFIKGLIISDKFGRAFLDFEVKPGFFKEIMKKNEHNADIQVISMFFSAINDFGKTLDADGFNSIYLAGNNLQIAILIYQKLTGIYFLENIMLDKQLFNTLTLFMKDFVTEFSSEIEQFFNLSSIRNVEYIKERLKVEVNNLNDLMEILIQDKEVLPKDDLLRIYQQLENESIDDGTIKNMKKIIFQYIVTEDPTLIKEISSIMEKKA